ncbi:MAG: hypothetical protein KBS76_03715, partial [Ruminococcus sp.]|nr:hypothetical protein [Candidatus Apopatosoma intestinale]
MLDVLTLCQYYVDGCKYDPNGYAVRLLPGKRLNVHTHSLQAVAAKEATCDVAGNIACWYCAGCGKYFSDANGQNEIELTSILIPATGHKYSTEWSKDESGHWHEATCEHKDTLDKKDFAAHTWNDNHVCTVCGYSHVHSLQAVAAKEATCTEAGNTAYWSCAVCGKIFSDAEG